MQRTVIKTKTFFGHPYPLSSLFLTEMWERFSFYGVRPLLILFMSATLLQGGMGLTIEQASAIVGIFAGGVYITSLPGGWLADNWLGQRKAVWYGSLIIALGHLSIAFSAIWGNSLFLSDYYSLYWEPVYLKLVLLLWLALCIEKMIRGVTADFHCSIWELTWAHLLHR